MKLFGTLRELVAAVFRKDGHEITLRPNQTSSLYTTNRAVSLPQVDNDVVLTASGYIANPDIAAAAGIVDTKLATIATAGKVSNSATTATDANTPSAIVARNASGDFSAGTITASLSGNASTATTATSFSGSLSGEVTGTQSATVVADNVIDNDNIKSNAGIVDTKLATIATAGKVSNSATTATSVNTASAIVARDGSGNFSAGTVSASGVNVSGLTASRAVVTDGSKNLASLEYTTADTGSTLMARDVAGSTSVNTLTAANIDVTGLATMNKAVIDGTTGDGFIDFVGQVAAPAVPPSAAARLFAGTDGKLYVRKTGSSQAEELGAGGSGEINLVDNSSDAGNWGVVNATATTNTTAANNPLSGTIDTSIAIASSTSGGYARYRFSMPSALKQRKLKLEWYQIASSLTSGAYRVEVWTNASSDYSGAYTELSLSTDSSGTSSIPNLNGKYSTTFDTNGSDYYEIRIVRTAASAATLYIANVVCGPGIQPQGAVVGEWQSYTPSGSYTTNTTYTGKYRRVGDSIEILIDMSFSGAPNSTTLSMTQAQYLAGLNLTVNQSALPNSTDVGLAVGIWTLLDSGVNGSYSGLISMDGGATKTIYFGYPTGQNTAAGVGSGLPIAVGSGDNISARLCVPIAEWAGSGTVQLAQNDVTYYYGTGGTWGTSGTVTTGQGPGGVLGGTTTPAGTFFNWTIVPTSPVQVGSVAVLETSPDGKNWSVGTNTQLPSTVEALRYDGTNWIGAGAQVNSSGNIVAFFGKYSFGIAGAWSSVGTWYWRVKIVAPGAAVGFGIVSPGVSAGLVSASGLPGNTTGNAIASGYVGEYITWVAAPTTQEATTTETDWTNATITLTKGVWQIVANITGSATTAATAAAEQNFVAKITDSANAIVSNLDKQITVKTVANSANYLLSVVPYNAIVTVTDASKVFKIRIVRGYASGSAFALNGVSSRSEFFAVRIA